MFIGGSLFRTTLHARFKCLPIEYINLSSAHLSSYQTEDCHHESSTPDVPSEPNARFRFNFYRAATRPVGLTKFIHSTITYFRSIDPNSPKIELFENATNELNSLVKEIRNCKDPDIKASMLQEIQSISSTLETLTENIPKAIYTDWFLNEFISQRAVYASADINYGGLKGLITLGPWAVRLKKNIIKSWEEHFNGYNQLNEIESSILTSDRVFKASGHVDRFSDVWVEIAGTKKSVRLDKVISDHIRRERENGTISDQAIEKLENILRTCSQSSNQQLTELLKEVNIRTNRGDAVVNPKNMNLMLSTNVGVKDSSIRYFLRPETSQAIFSNAVGQLKKIPFGIFQIGKCFRNEIGASSLTRLREFTLAEISFFVDPESKDHPDFNRYKQGESTVYLYTEEDQKLGNETTTNKISINDALDKNIIRNEALAYYIAEVKEFLVAIGFQEDTIRFRQQMKSELAHYAIDCWDCECLSLNGWLECVGVADRASKDVENHARKMRKKLQFDVLNAEPPRKVTPHVIEASFGIERILRVLLEQNMKQRNEFGVSYFSFKPAIAPVQCQLHLESKAKEEHGAVCDNLISDMRQRHISCSMQVRKRTSKAFRNADCEGTPYLICMKNTCNVVFLRDRDTREEIQVETTRVAYIVDNLLKGRYSWQEAKEKYDLVSNQNQNEDD